MKPSVTVLAPRTFCWVRSTVTPPSTAPSSASCSIAVRMLSASPAREAGAPHPPSGAIRSCISAMASATLPHAPPFTASSMLSVRGRSSATGWSLALTASIRTAVAAPPPPPPPAPHSSVPGTTTKWSRLTCMSAAGARRRLPMEAVDAAAGSSASSSSPLGGSATVAPASRCGARLTLRGSARECCSTTGCCSQPPLAFFCRNTSIASCPRFCGALLSSLELCRSGLAFVQPFISASWLGVYTRAARRPKQRVTCSRWPRGSSSPCPAHQPRRPRPAASRTAAAAP
mmetsp:Transcript_33027/g.82723  ORF Transcript_33027/g.82723 Transcript_33027/m.82723 type:complete len:287 (+) Transcript_33027:218-1078(+)